MFLLIALQTYHVAMTEQTWPVAVQTFMQTGAQVGQARSRIKPDKERANE